MVGSRGQYSHNLRMHAISQATHSEVPTQMAATERYIIKHNSQQWQQLEIKVPAAIYRADASFR